MPMRLDRADVSIPMPVVDVFVCNDTIIDEEIFQLWIDGHNVSAAAKLLGSDSTEGFPDAETILSDVEDHYRMFAILEPVLHSPRRLGDQLKFQIRLETQSYLLQKYYELDDVVIREIMGKKFSARIRKDLDDVSVKISIPLPSCRRQFDNVKLIYKTVEEMSGCVKDNIQREFLLPEPLAFRYAAVVFFTFNRFETSKRKLHSVGFERFAACAKAMMDTWTDLEMDTDFFMDLKELRALQEREKDLRSLTIEGVSAEWKGPSKATFKNECEAIFKVFSRGLISIATVLHRTKEVRDFFPTIMEKVLEPLRGMKWNEEQLECFLTCYVAAGMKLDLAKKSNGLCVKSLWTRYMNTMKICIQELHCA